MSASNIVNHSTSSVGKFSIFQNIKNGFILLFALICYIFVVTLNIPIYIFRLIVIHILAPWLKPDLSSSLNALSSFLVTDLFSGRAPRATTIVPLTINGNLTRDELLFIVKKNWIDALDEEDGQLKYPQFQYYPVYWLGFPFWRHDPNFNVENHVLSYSEQRSIHTGNEMVTEQELDAFVEHLLNAPYTPQRSPWNLHIVENYKNYKFCGSLPLQKDEPVKSVIVMKIHHSMADGFSLLDALVEGLIGVKIEDLKIPKLSRPKRSFWENFVFYSTIPFMAAIELAIPISNVFKQCPWKSPDSVKCWHHRYAKSELIHIDKVKHTKNVLGVGFTTVLLSAISAGIHKSLEEKRRKGTMRVEKHDDNMLCISAIPLPETKASKRIRLKNNTIALVFDIPSNAFHTAVDRLRRCDEILEKCKKSVVPSLVYWYIQSIGCLIGSMPSSIGKNRMVSTGLTSFPTKPKTDKFGGIAGKEILFAEFAAGALVGDAGVGFMVISFYPYIRLSVTAESSVLSRDEINNLVKYIEEEFKVLCSIAEAIKPSSCNS